MIEANPIIIQINSTWCKGCKLCMATCPKKLINLSNELNQLGFHFAVVNNPKECTGCTLCAQVCPDLAIEIWRPKY